jgi:dipeptidyl aminopeptidase/acylaminoacyl peptidase
MSLDASRWPLLLLLVSLPAALARGAGSDGDGTTWRRPPEAVEAAVTAPPPATLDYAPGGRWVLVVEREALPPLARVARPLERLAGLRIDPVTHARFTLDAPTALTLRPLTDADAARGDLRLALPEGERITGWTWSLDGRRLALVSEGTTGTSLLVVSPDEGNTEPKRLAGRLVPLFVAPKWTAEGDALLAALVPAGDSKLPARRGVAAGPVVLETHGTRTPLRTYQDLLHDADDAARFAALARAELALVPITGGAPVRFDGLPADLWTRVELAPNGRRLLTARLQPPFSYRHPWGDFAQLVEVHDSVDGALRSRVIASLPVASEVPIGGVRTGPRDVQWLPGLPSSLVWVEALDGGDPRAETARRDRWVRLDLGRELEGEPRTLVEVEHRATGILFTNDPDRFVVREFDRARREVREVLHDSRERIAPMVLDQRSASDAYADPGRLVTQLDDRGHTILRRDGPFAYRIGAGATPEGDRPFLARQSLETAERGELWRSGADEYARVVEFLAGDSAGAVWLVIRSEAHDRPPRDTLVPLALPGESGNDRAPRVVHVAEDPTPALRAIEKVLLTTSRADGVELSGLLHLPPGAEPATTPLLVWAYPREYTDASLAGQVRVNAERFTTVAGASPLALVLAGFAVLEDASMPIVGDPETMNDTFVAQLTANAEALVELCVARGFPRARIAVGGHSYGAFMTANLLAHTDVFACGIARSGAYNRTLTPFGFQAERRPLWDARDVYYALSPFLYADRINEPLLLLHGADDSNSGTFPEQSERLFAALQGLGGTARLVLLPHEDHGYRSREAVLHTLAEMHDWLAKYLRR